MVIICLVYSEFLEYSMIQLQLQYNTAVVFNSSRNWRGTGRSLEAQGRVMTDVKP